MACFSQQPAPRTECRWSIELGIALDLLVAVFILGIFFFQIREQFDSLDLHHLESLKEE